MSNVEETTIEFSKFKIFMFLVVSCAFIALGVWMFSLEPSFFAGDSQPRNLISIHLSGLALAIFASLVVIKFFKKLFVNKPGLLLNGSGIVDNSSAAAPVYIPWSEIKGTRIFKFKSQKFLVILVKDPQKYINRGNALKRYMNNANYKMCGSPITIATNFLKTNLPELTEIFDKYHEKYRTA